jgi:hypothetical protein
MVAEMATNATDEGAVVVSPQSTIDLQEPDGEKKPSEKLEHVVAAPRDRKESMMGTTTVPSMMISHNMIV